MTSAAARVPSLAAPRTLTASEIRRVIFASSLGTMFEWYDFYLFGSLAAVISRHFFSGVNPTAAFIFALLAFAAGFAVRPFGALVFGRLGDLVGRKYTFLITIVIMGLATSAVGFLPTYASIGLAAPVILIVLRMLQGLALGGEYGGAATYVAEHAPAGKRGAYTSWIQTTATLGLLLSLLVILAARTALGTERFDAWGWRIPFLLSVVLLAISVWIRLELEESPLFHAMREEGRLSKAPLTESFARWDNARLVLLALFGLTAGQAVVWYTGQFYTLFFLTQTLKVDPQTANILLVIALVLGAPLFVVVGALSDRVGRKPLIMLGCLLAALTYFPVFRLITHYANPALEAAQRSAPVVVAARPAGCSVQFNPVGTSKFTSPCNVAKAALVKRGVPYANEAVASEHDVMVRVGMTAIPSYDATAPDAKTRASEFDAALGVGPRRGWLPRERRSGAHRQTARGAPPLAAHRVRDAGVRTDRRHARGDVSHEHPLHVDVAPVSHRQRVVRRLPPDHRVRDRRRHRRHLCGAPLSGGDRGDHARDREPVRARDQRHRYQLARVAPIASFSRCAMHYAR